MCYPEKERGFMLQMGLLYGGILERCGHTVKIIDLYVVDNDFLYNAIKEFNRAIIVFGGIASSYGRTREL